VTVKLTDASLLDATRSWVMSNYRDVIVERPCPETDENRDSELCFRVSSDYADSIKRAALAQAIETIRSRIDNKGIAEPTVIAKGDDIIVELPGVAGDARVNETKDIIAR